MTNKWTRLLKAEEDFTDFFILPSLEYDGGNGAWSDRFSEPQFHHIKTLEEAQEILNAIIPEDYAEYDENGNNTLTFRIWQHDNGDEDFSVPTEYSKSFKVNYPERDRQR